MPYNIFKTTGFHFLAGMRHVVPLHALIRLTRQALVCPFYHSISDTTPLHLKHLYPVKNKNAFVKDLDFLLKHYKPVDYKTVLDSLKSGTALKGNNFLLSFDDGLSEFHDVIAPILIEKGIPAICFLNTRFIDNKELFFRYKASVLLEALSDKNLAEDKKHSAHQLLNDNGIPSQKDFGNILKINYDQKAILDALALLINVDFKTYLREATPYLESSQIKTLLDKGFHFGAHSADHPEYRYIPLADQLAQTSESIDFVSTHFHTEHPLFSFPFNDTSISKRFFETVFDPTKPMAALTFGCAGLKHDDFPFHLQRIPFEEGSLTAHEILTKEYLYYLLKGVFNKNTIRRTNGN
jgi:peptidoglycan/xylan/chitin deacetylase (PgdA/CDA1 family)